MATDHEETSSRTTHLHIPVTIEMRAEVHRMAALADMNASQYVRQAITAQITRDKRKAAR
jgi:hypothetical protein